VTNGIVLALFAYAFYAWSDAANKALGGTMSVFEIGFFQMAIAGLIMLATRPDGHGWLDFWRMREPLIVQVRAVNGAVGAMISVYAFTSIPLAEVYAIVFLAPIIVTLLSMLFLKEKVGPWRWLAIVLGFIGVLVVVRPGFRVLELGHLAAVFMAFMGAMNVILGRRLAERERTTTILGYLMTYSILLNAIAMGATTVSVPDFSQAWILLITGAGVAGGHMFILRAARYVQASQIAPTQYSQLAWAVLLGALFFDELPDFWSIVGLCIIAAAGLLTMARERIRLGTVRWTGKNRL
jgi:drug/metabolite transporter (DMT)-like permease